MSTFQERLELAFRLENERRASNGQKRLTKTEIWKAADASSGAATHWFDGSNGMDLDTCIKASMPLGCNQFWLFDESQGMSDGILGSGGISFSEALSLSSNFQRQSMGAKSELSNFEQAPALRGRVPLISFVQAGSFAEVIDNFHPGDGEDWIDVTCPVNRYTFALRVVGDSMEPDFPAGMIIVVEPEMQFEPNDFVIAKNGDSATFKQLITDGGEWYLKPLNQRYPIKSLGESRIIGVVREAVRKFR